MYCEHFGFTEKPFDMTPDPKYLYLSPSHKEVLASLIYGIRERRGFITIVGEVGTGKTTLLNAALDQLDENTKAAYIFNTSVTFEQMLNMALFELGLNKSDESLSKTHAIDRLNNFAIEQLALGGNVALIIDEAQNLDTRSIESLRLLSNLETRKHKLIQLIIAGQPELDAILGRHELRQLTQRISLKRYVIPLSKKETNDYIRHRLAVADFKGSHLFDRRAQKLIWEYSHGIPRKINILCDNAFLTGYGAKKKRITTSLMAEAIKDLTWSPFSPSIAPPAPMATKTIEERPRVNTWSMPRRLSLAPGLALIAVLIFGVGFILKHFDLSWPENISRLSQHVFQPQKMSPGAGSVKTPAATLPDDDVQASMTRKVESARIPAEEVEATPVPAEEVEAAPVPVEEVEAASVPAEEVEAASVPAEEVEAARVQAEEADLASTAAAVQTQFLPESVDTPEETKKEEAQLVAEETTEGPDALQALEGPRQRPPLNLFIRPGDTLGKIIKEHYGSYNKEILSAVLHENPEIQNPDRILAGQILKLPLPSEKP